MTANHADQANRRLADKLAAIAAGLSPEQGRLVKQAAFLVRRDPVPKLHELLDELGAPTKDGGVEFRIEGRLRALVFNLTTDANQQRAALAAERQENEELRRQSGTRRDFLKGRGA